MPTLTDYRTHLDNLLATAVDSSTWTQAIKDQALRMALEAYDNHPAYEVTFTVTLAGHAQTLTAITDLKQILQIYYPWDDHSPLVNLPTPFRFTGSNTLWIDHAEPQVGQKIRVRYLKHHTIQTLDSAAGTTVPDLDQHALATYAASFACLLRARQLSENPAPPASAVATLERLGVTYAVKAQELLRPLHPSPIAWSQMGLEL